MSDPFFQPSVSSNNLMNGNRPDPGFLFFEFYWESRMAEQKHRVCPWYLAYLFDNPLRRLFHNPAEILGPYLRPGMTVMDIGCGMGFFSLGMARLVGSDGKVLSLDIQPQMLSVLVRRAKRAGLFQRIETKLIEPDGLGVDEPVDFALAFWMVHEVPDQAVFFQEVADVLHPGSRMFVSEPKPHVTEKDLEETTRIAEEVGFKVLDRPPVRLGLAVVLEKSSDR